MIDNAINEILKATDISLQNSNLWELTVLGIGEDPNIRYRIQSITLPFLGFEIETRKTGTKHFTNYTSEDEFSITFLETTNFDTFNFLNNWKNQIYDPIKRVFRSDGRLHVKNLQLAFQKDEVIRIIGPLNIHYRHSSKGFLFQRTLFKNMTSLDLNYTSIDPLTITATFICDTIIPIEPEYTSIGRGVVGTLKKFEKKLNKKFNR